MEYDPKYYGKYPDGKIKRFLYDHNLPFSKKLDENINDLTSRIQSNKASLLIIDGPIGYGKTTLGTHVADFSEGRPISFEHQLAMGGVQFQEKLQICVDKKKKVIVYDEAGDFDKRGSITKFNMMLNRIFDTYRTYKILVILCLPNFNVLDNSLFDKQIPRMLLHCCKRNDYYGDYKAYSLYRMFYLKKRMAEITVKPQAYGRVDPNFVGHFLDLPPERSMELHKFSTSGKQNILSDNILKARDLVCYADISKKILKSIRWIQSKIKKLKIKPAMTYKKRLYFNAGIIDILREEVAHG